MLGSDTSARRCFGGWLVVVAAVKELYNTSAYLGGLLVGGGQYGFRVV
jgi:hypothetical protein